MTTVEAPPPEPSILRSRLRGEVSAKAAFEQFCALYSRTVLGWLQFNAAASDMDDLF